MILLISALHLQQQHPDLTRAFLHFLRDQASGAKALYILGDFFESWIGDNAMTPYQRDIAKSLKALADGGTAIYLMHGNRDFLLGKVFCRLAGCQLLPDPSLVNLDGKNVLLSHGDALCTQDIGYQRLRRVLRNPLLLGLLDHLPRRVKLAIATWLRRQSQKKTRYKAAHIVDVTPEEVPPLLARYGVDTLIHGHTHRPARHAIRLANGQQGERIVLGDWDKRGWAIQAQDGQLRLIDFPLEPPPSASQSRHTA